MRLDFTASTGKRIQLVTEPIKGIVGNVFFEFVTHLFFGAV